KRAVETLTVSITEKIISDPILVLKRKAERSGRDTYLDVTRNLFGLDQDNNGEEQNGHQ
ncbi:MAG TPA: glutamyl-tRNA reductase, partial [Desulfobacteraceae bacterium]|nr:glutamyl-tRNA reductase [Desulfobacteraceae bacterium]